jgi:hypothetical protein
MILLSFINYNTAVAATIAPEDVFLIKSSSKSMDDVVSSVKKYIKEKKWVYIGNFKVKKGQVILVKFCVKAAGKLAWKAGLKVSAMLPCGNLGVYQNKGKTEVSLLSPYYMTSLYPNDNLTAAADLLMPMYKEMLSTIVN